MFSLAERTRIERNNLRLKSPQCQKMKNKDDIRRGMIRGIAQFLIFIDVVALLGRNKCTPHYRLKSIMNIIKAILYI